MTLDTFYRPEELAAKLKVTRRSVYQWLLDGRLKGEKVGDTWRISEEHVRAFMAVREKRTPAIGPRHPDYQRWLNYFKRVGLPTRNREQKGQRPMKASNDELIARAIRAHNTASKNEAGPQAQQPSAAASSVEVVDGTRYVVLRNVSGTIRVYKVRGDDRLMHVTEWPEGLA